MKTYGRYLSVIGLLVVLALASCVASGEQVPTAALAQAAFSGVDVIDVDAQGITDVDLSALAEAINAVPTGELSAVEIEGILYMREEEKLARDVYLALYEEWGTRIFQNIARSESTHMDAVKTLIERYGLEDPAAGKDEGVFVNETLQGLYDELVAQGSQSLADALRVGAAIEEIDILDLETYVAQTDRADIQTVYGSLTKGSRNHLRAFVRSLERTTGQGYEPQYLDQGAYEAIVGSDVERGRGRGS